MPMSRYELRNEFTLAEPDLYRAADKDDPEALLEGVAMSGLVGLLRQLGDLAEFAAEIFHDLHDEVMATAARGYGLMIRVQQFEAEAPSIEKAFLSQRDHSSFSHNTGVEWHPSLQMEMNLVTRGDLPRFIMDSYEECRGPPRLFLLDKFDIAGPGACLKRYTDPSFFKVELSSSEMTNAKVQGKKKILRAKTKGPRWRNGETIPEVLTSHAKLNQLFMEERVENGVSHSTPRVKLKRRLNGFPFDSNMGKSYMEELLKSTFPEHKELHEVTMKPLIVPANNHNESGLEVLGVGLMSHDRESMERKRSPSSSPSPDRLEITLKQSIHKPNEVFIDNEISEAPNSYPDMVNKDIALTLDMVTNEGDATVDGERKPEGSLTDYQSDDISSEIDNYVDAPSTMESEMDTDTELKAKSDITSSFTKRQQLISDANEEISDTSEEQAHTPADSHSTENSTLSNDGNNSSGKELSNFTPSDSSRTSSENTESECDVTAISSPSADVFESSTIDMPSYHNTTQEDLPAFQHSKSVISDDTCTDTAAITNHRSDLDWLTSSLNPVDLTPTLAHFDLEGVTEEGRLRGPESNETSSPLDQEDNRASLVIDQSCTPCASDSETQSGDNSPRFSCGDHLVDKSNGESIPCLATKSGNLCHTSDSPVALSADFLHDWYSDQEDLNLSVDKASTSNICNAHPQNRDDTLSLISIENPNQNSNELDDGITKVRENSISICPGIAHIGDSFTSTMSEGEKLMDDLDNEDPCAFSDASCIMEASLGKKFEETSSGNVQNVDIESQYSNSSADKQLGSQNYSLSHVEHSLDWHGKNLDTQYSNGVIPIEQMTTAETPSVRILKFCEEGLQNTEIPGDVYSHDSAALGSSSHDLEKLEKSSRSSDTVVNYKNTPCTCSIGQEVTKISSSSYLTSLNEVHVLLDATDCQRDQSEIGVMAISVPVIAGSDNKDDVYLLLDLDKSVEGSIPCFGDLGLNKLNDNENCLSGCHGESDLLEVVGQRAAAASDLSRVFCNTVVYGNLKPEVSETVPDSYLELGVECSLDLVSDATIQSSLGPIDFDTDQESFERSGLWNHVSDIPSLTVDCSTEETISQEKIELSPNQLDQNLLNSDEINSESSPLLPINPGQMLDHDDHNVGGNSASTISHINCPCALSIISEFPEQSNYIIDISGRPKEPLGSTSPHSNPCSETIQIDLEELPPLPPLPPVQWRMGKLQLAFSASEGEIMQHTKLSSIGVFPPIISIDDASSSHELPNQSLNQIILDTTSKEVEVEKSCSLEANNMKHETIDLPQSTENEKQQLVVSYSESGFISPTVENGVANESHADKLLRPRNPLIDAVAAIDKSKLRKVTKRVRPEIQKLDERDSLLEQIRTKSFNLKPALASRPSIRGPKTNLKVAAILEKANAIRQALADSDEDDEGGWSDS